MSHAAEVREYLDAKGNNPYARWFDRLNVTAAVKVATAIHRMEQGNLSNVKGVGTGIYEYRIISVLVIGFTSVRMRTSPPPNHIGATINAANGKRCNNGPD